MNGFQDPYKKISCLQQCLSSTKKAMSLDLAALCKGLMASPILKIVCKKPIDAKEKEGDQLTVNGDLHEKCVTPRQHIILGNR